MSATVLVLGSTGRFGSAATRAFAAAGWRVIAQRRTRTAGDEAPAGVQWLHAPLAQAATEAARLGRIDVVVHAMNPSRYSARAWREQAPALMAAAIDAAHRLDALLMFPGNVYNFGERMPEVLHEHTLQSPSTHHGRVRVAIEAQLARAAEQNGVRSVVIRAGDFFGSGVGSMLDRVMLQGVRRGRIDLPGDLDTPTPWAYLPDLARGFVRVAMERERLAGAECLHFSGHHRTGRDWLQALACVALECGWIQEPAQVRPGSLPWGVIRAGGLLLPEWASHAEMRYLWKTPHALHNARLRALIGEEPHTVFGEAVRTAVFALTTAQHSAGVRRLRAAQ